MKQRQIILSSFLILLLGFFSTQGSLTGQVVRDTVDVSFDVTQDGLVDAADLQDALELATYGIYHSSADFNHDQKVDQLDVDLLTAYLSP